MAEKRSNAAPGGGLGPWATMLDVGPQASLSAFWRRRMAMLADACGASPRVSRLGRVVLVAAGLAALAMPLVRLMPPAIAEDNAKRPPQPAMEFFPAPSEAEARILAELDKPTKMEFIETPLADAVAFLSDLHAIPIQLDHQALEDLGVSDDTALSLQLEGVKLRSALKLLLGKHLMAATVAHDVLLITSHDKADEQLLTRTYPVGDLVDGDDLEAYTILGIAITSAVRPKTWDGDGGPGTLSPVTRSQSMVISQTREVHDEVLQLLRSLRAAKEKKMN